MIDYSQLGLLLRKGVGMVDYAIAIDHVSFDNREFVVVVNLHENRVVVLECGREWLNRAARRVVFTQTLFRRNGTYRRLVGRCPEVDAVGSHESRRDRMTKKIDYLGYSFHDRWSYTNTANGDALCPQQVSSSILWDFVTLLKAGKLLD